MVVSLNNGSTYGWSVKVLITYSYYGTGSVFMFGSRSGDDDAGNYSFTAGESLIASVDNQCVVGQFNSGNKAAAFIVGNGSDENNRTNALEVGWDGSAYVAGNLELGAPLGVGYGGTGQSSVSTVSTVSTLITAASGTTISAAYFKRWGKLALLQVSFKRTSSWAANAQVDIGTVKTGYRPALLVNGGNANVLAHLNGSGVMRARNMTGAAIATTTQQDIGFTFLLP
jgi:hypothetical protein